MSQWTCRHPEHLDTTFTPCEEVMKTPEFKKMMGHRMMDSDGFTYVYGATKDGSTVRPATAATKFAVRKDKRSVKAKEIKRIMAEQTC